MPPTVGLPRRRGHRHRHHHSHRHRRRSRSLRASRSRQRHFYRGRAPRSLQPPLDIVCGLWARPHGGGQAVRDPRASRLLPSVDDDVRLFGDADRARCSLLPPRASSRYLFRSCSRSRRAWEPKEGIDGRIEPWSKCVYLRPLDGRTGSPAEATRDRDGGRWGRCGRGWRRRPRYSRRRRRPCLCLFGIVARPRWGG